jgi:DNA polymerase (family X)
METVVSPSPTLPRGAPELRDNAVVAERLREMAALLEAQGDNAFRVAAYRNAAQTVAGLKRDLREMFEREGLAGLDALPTIGPGIAAAIAEMLHSGRWSRLEQLRGTAGPEALLRAVPGIGPHLATRLHDELGVHTLEALEVAAHDGRLERMARIGPRRAAAIRAALTPMLDRVRVARRNRPSGADAALAPPVAMLLDVDREYRDGAAADRLPKIAPKRFNPSAQAWLPVLHAARDGWHFTALYSNTARAHELDRVHDWVVIYAEDEQHHERQYTVVTAATGSLAGRRIVRGREDECRAAVAAAR